MNNDTLGGDAIHTLLHRQNVHVRQVFFCFHGRFAPAVSAANTNVLYSFEFVQFYFFLVYLIQFSVDV